MEKRKTDSTQNRPSRSVFRNAFRLSRVIVSHHLPSQIPLAGKGLTACILIGPAIYRILIGWKIHRLPAQPITAVLLVFPPFIGRFLDPYHLHHRGACVPPHVILVFLLCAFSTMDTKPCHQHGREEKANARCDILHIPCGPCHKRYCKNETDQDNFDTLHTSSIPPPWAEISSYDTGGWFCTASTNKMVSPIYAALANASRTQRTTQTD